MLTVVDGAATTHTISSLRAACDLLDGAAGRINAVSVSGVLPDDDDPTCRSWPSPSAWPPSTAWLCRSGRGRRFVVEFRRGQPTDRRLSEAG